MDSQSSSDHPLRPPLAKITASSDRPLDRFFGRKPRLAVIRTPKHLPHIHLFLHHV